ncbi:carboxymuconolactone decarboxylase family protein [Derxia lacustris]|uniref:carboxymuconolactone decarboxylase family protein n=1 Tax=Derxia lacustris TaxID=764842 RepID=UPI000A16D533|nr:carboxymuconolactone decarboxylase family protein [Derxia lacustris]
MTAASTETRAPHRRPPVSLDDIAAVTPVLAHYTATAIVQGVWQRPGLNARERRVTTLAAFIARGQTIGLPHYFRLALDSGLTPAELSELVTHLAFYAGWPNAFEAVAPLKDLFDERGIGADQLPAATLPLLPVNVALPDAADSRAATTAGIGAVSPGLGHFTATLLHDEVWRRPGLAPHLRNLATLVALIAGGQAQLLPRYLPRALLAGVTREQLSEVLAQLAFYAGWPVTVAALPVLEAFFAQQA